MIEVTIKPTRLERDTGERNTRNSCPIAFALYREGFKRVQVNRGQIIAYYGKTRLFADMPEQMIIDLWGFDAGESFPRREYDLVFQEVA